MLVPNRHGSSNSYRYGFNGMEKDDELKGIGNSYDFGARMLDPRVGRWFAPDPLESKFTSFSTYNFTLNNPILYVDIDGKDIFIPTTSDPNQFKGTKYSYLSGKVTPLNNFKDPNDVLIELQKATNDKLKLVAVKQNEKIVGYRVEIDIKGGANTDKNYEKGTALLRELIGEKKKTVSIVKPPKGQIGNETNDLFNGNSIVKFDNKFLADGENGIVNDDGTTGRPIFIGLIHEILHGKSIMKGLSMTMPVAKVKDPDNDNKAKTDFPTEEIDVRNQTNEIINEHIGEKHDGKEVKKRAKTTRIKQFGKEIKS